MWLFDPPLVANLQALGRPRIIEIALPLAATHDAPNAATTALRTFALSRDCVAHKHGIDLSAVQRLPPSAILAVHTEGDPTFHAAGRDYPGGLHRYRPRLAESARWRGQLTTGTRPRRGPAWLQRGAARLLEGREPKADYLGAYLVARAGYDLDRAGLRRVRLTRGGPSRDSRPARQRPCRSGTARSLAAYYPRSARFLRPIDPAWAVFGTHLAATQILGDEARRYAQSGACSPRRASAPSDWVAREWLDLRGNWPAGRAVPQRGIRHLQALPGRREADCRPVRADRRPAPGGSSRRPRRWLSAR